MKPVTIALLASGSGTNAENIMRYFQAEENVSFLVITNRADAGVVERAQNLKVPAFHLPASTLKDGPAFCEFLAGKQVDWVVLAGYLLLVPVEVLKAYPQKVVNLHPALLPKYGGKGMYGAYVHEAVIASGDSHTGITIHYCNEVYDAGAIILQAICEVMPDDTPATLATRVHALEYQYYPKVLEELLNEEYDFS